MLKKAFIIFFLILGFNSKAQIWTPLDTGLQSYIPYGLLADDTNGNLFAFGNMFGCKGLNVWRNSKWEVWYPNREWGTYGNEVAILNNKVLYFNKFNENNDNSKPRTAILEFSDSTNLDTLKILQNQDWFPTPNQSFCIYNGKLILFSTLSFPSGINSIATFDGDTIIPIGDASIDGFGSACVYNGDLYAAGSNMSAQRGVFKKTASGWQLIYQIQGSFAGIQGMMVYNNRLFIYGGMSSQINASNLGEGIIAYDGVNFDTLGGGIINEFDISDGKIYDAAISGGKLYVTGNFSQAGGAKARCIAYWNDTTWCTLHKDLDTTYNFFRIESFKDSIYQVADFREVNGDTTFGWIAKLYDKNYSDTCSAPVSVSVTEIINAEDFELYPNPVTSLLNIIDKGNKFQNSFIEIQDNLGQVVYANKFTSQINLSGLPPGIYFLNTTGHIMIKALKILKQ